MQVEITENEKKKARIPHNIFMLNLALFHLLMTPAAIALEIGTIGMMLPLVLSLAIIFYTHSHKKNIQNTEHWFVVNHWELAIKRYKLLLFSYLITAVLMLTGWLLAMGSPDPNMQDILKTVFIRIAIMPVLLMVMINFYLESSAINLASKGELPDSMKSASSRPH